VLLILARLINLYTLIVVARILFTWIPVSPWTPLGKVVHVLASITDPILNPIRRVIPPIRSGAMAIDLSPLILVLALSFIGSRL
jgi:YggT family protein